MYRLLSVAALVAGLSVPALADSATLHSTAKADGTWWEVAEGRLYWAGTYWVFSFNDAGEGFSHEMVWNCPATGVVVDGVGKFTGSCIKTDRDGDKIFSSWVGGFSPGEQFTGRETYEGGSGKYEGITGGHDFQCEFFGPDEQGMCRQQIKYTLKQ